MINKLKEGVLAWNKWQKENSKIKPNLRDADLRGANLFGANLFGANLRDADLFGADLRDANLRDADLRGAKGFFTFGPMPTSGRMVLANLVDSEWIVYAGCFTGSVIELEERVKESHNCPVYLGVCEILKNYKSTDDDQEN